MRSRCSGPNCLKTTMTMVASKNLASPYSGERQSGAGFNLFGDPCFARSPTLFTPARSLFPRAKFPVPERTGKCSLNPCKTAFNQSRNRLNWRIRSQKSRFSL
jgi:hypothetical protein